MISFFYIQLFAGLFRAAIAQSGSALNPWTYQRHAKNIAYQFAAQFDATFTTDKSSEDLLELLQSIPEDQLAEVASNFKPVSKDSVYEKMSRFQFELYACEDLNYFFY